MRKKQGDGENDGGKEKENVYFFISRKKEKIDADREYSKRIKLKKRTWKMKCFAKKQNIV